MRRGSAGAAESGERRFACETVDVLARGGEQLPGVTGGDPEQLDGAGRSLLDALLKLSVELADLTVERVDWVRDRSQCELRRVTWEVDQWNTPSTVMRTATSGHCFGPVAAIDRRSLSSGSLLSAIA